jgi:hypothetical protein
MRNHRLITSLIGVLTILVAGCDLQSSGSLNPNVASAIDIRPVLLGTWTASSPQSVTAASGSTLPDPSSCHELEFTITEQSGVNYAGSFKARCAGGVELTGVASGTYVDNVMNITAKGTLAISHVAQCSFELTGTATVTSDEIAINYSGTTCLGPVSGEETLQRG